MTRSRSGTALTAALVIPALALAGCVGAEDGAPTTTAFDGPGAGKLPATVVLEVTSAGSVPIEGASVELSSSGGALTGRTDARGTVVLEEVPPGPARASIAAPGHVPRAIDLEVPSGARLVEPVVLAPLAANQTYVQTYEFEGFFECSATMLIITGDCFATTRELGRQAGVPLGENATNERFVFPFVVDPGWIRILITQTWDEPAAGLGTMMRVNVEPAQNADNEMHNERYARAEGRSPVVLELTPGTLHDGASQDPLVMPEDGGVFQTRSFHLGLADAHNPGGTEFLGAGAAFQQHFNIVVEVEYG